jgi:hypothetical protein
MHPSTETITCIHITTTFCIFLASHSLSATRKSTHPTLQHAKKSNLVFLNFGPAELQGIFRRCLRRQTCVALIGLRLLDAGRVFAEDRGNEGQSGNGEEELHCDCEMEEWSGNLN